MNALRNLPICLTLSDRSIRRGCLPGAAAGQPARLQQYRIGRRIRPSALLMGVMLLFHICHAGPLPAAEVDVYQLRNVSPTETRRMLRELAQYHSDEMDIDYHWETGELLVRGPQELRTFARQLVEQFDQPAAPPVPVADVIRIHHVAPARRAAIAMELQQVYQDQAGIAADSSESGLVVVAKPAVQDQVARHLSSLPGSLDAPAQQQRAYGGYSPTDSRLADTYAESGLPTIHPRSSRPPLPAESSLRVASEETALPIIAGNSPAVRTEPLAAPSDAPPQFSTWYAFRVRPVNEVIGALESLIPDGVPSTRAHEYVIRTAGHNHVVIRFEEHAQRCLLTGTDALVRQTLDLLSQLDSRQPEPGRITRFIAVRNAEAHKLQEAIQAWRSVQSPAPLNNTSVSSPPNGQTLARTAAYRALGINEPTAAAAMAAAPVVQATPPPLSDVDIQSLPDLKILILQGEGADVEELTSLVNGLELISAETTPTVLLFPLHYVQGESLQPLADRLLQDPRAGLAGRVKITPLPRSGALLLIGWKDAVDQASQWIADLDQPQQAAAQIRVFPLQHAPVAQVQAALEEIYAARPDIAAHIEITAFPRTNSLIAEAPPRELQELDLLIQRLDAGKPDTAQPPERTARLP